MTGKRLGLLAVALLAGPIAANADESVTYDFTGVVTSETGNPGMIGDAITGTFTFTYDNRDTDAGTIGSSSPWSVVSNGAGIPQNTAVFATAVSGGYRSMPIPLMDPDGQAGVTSGGKAFYAYEYAAAYPSSSYLYIKGATPYNAEGLPVLSKGETAVGGFSLGGNSPIGVMFPGGVPDGGFAVQYNITSLTRVPEIDSASAATCLTLLLGSLLVVGSRRAFNQKDVF